MPIISIQYIKYVAVKMCRVTFKSSGPVENLIFIPIDSGLILSTERNGQNHENITLSLIQQIDSHHHSGPTTLLGNTNTLEQG